MQPVKGRSAGSTNNTFPLPHHGSTAQPEPRNFEETLNQPPLRDPIISRGRPPGTTNVLTNLVSQPAVQIMSPRSQSSAATARSPTGPDGALERRPSMNQPLHYANKSHGGYSHVRNASFVNSPATSPLSPHITTADYASMTMIHHGTSDLRPKESPRSLINGPNPLTPGSTIDREYGDGGLPALSQKRVDRTNNSRPRRAHSHKGTRSRQHHQDQKTVGEYALHHLFTSVCLHHPPQVFD